MSDKNQEKVLPDPWQYIVTQRDEADEEVLGKSGFVLAASRDEALSLATIDGEATRKSRVFVRPFQ